MPEVRAGGGVVWRSAPGSGDGEVEVLLVHRPRYDDWSFPKGKCEAGESYRAAAEREVHEETGLGCTVGAALGESRYQDHKGRSKVVRYWAMRAPDSGAEAEDFVPNDEVDEIRWLRVGEVAAELTYRHDETVLEAFERYLSTR